MNQKRWLYKYFGIYRARHAIRGMISSPCIVPCTRGGYVRGDPYRRSCVRVFKTLEEAERCLALQALAADPPRTTKVP